MGNTQQKLEVNLTNLEQTEERESEKNLQETEEDESATFTCEICIEPTPSTKKFKNNGLCVHPFCIDCLAKYIETKLEDNVANIGCPSMNCEQLLDPLVCRAFISVDVFSKWCDLLCESSVLVFRRCYCPYQNCSALIINECEEKTVKKTKCPNCKSFFCYTCKVPWHAGFWCSESRQRRDADDVAFGELVEKLKWTRCPFCGQAVELIKGCRLIKCRCGHSFCHICGKKIHTGDCTQQQVSCFRLECRGFIFIFSYSAIVTLICMGIHYLVKGHLWNY